MDALVFGGSGFLGSWTTRALLKAGHSVTAVVRDDWGWRLRDVVGVEIISVRPDRWASVLLDRRPEIAYLFDWAGVAASERGRVAQEANVSRQLALIDACAEVGVRRVVGVGSQAEYGPRHDVARETDLARPSGPYGQAKLAVLNHLRTVRQATGSEWVWARVFSAFGPLDNGGVLLATMADAFEKGESFHLETGSQPWSYLYAKDVADAMLALGVTGASGVFNVGHPEAPTLRSTAERFTRMFGSHASLTFGEPTTDPPALRPDVSRLMSLGWTPGVPLDSALSITAQWLKGIAVEDPFAAGTRLPRRPVRNEGLRAPS